MYNKQTTTTTSKMEYLMRIFTVVYFAMTLGEAASVSSMKKPIMKSLNLWIDGKETEKFIGIPMDIFVVKEGIVVPYLLEGYVDNQLPILPPEINLVTLMWQGTDDLYKYHFSDLRSLDPPTMYDPLLSIIPRGFVPTQRAEFQMAISCTGQVTGVASMYLVLHVYNSKGDYIPGAPIKLHLRKRCIAADKRSVCKTECKHGGQCNAQGHCDCAPGFYGPDCNQAVCFPSCVNGGTCTAPRKCACPPGYAGNYCETPVCNKPCFHGGSCVGPERCDCPRGYYGNYCQHLTGACAIPCKNGGTCTKDDQCACPAGYSGDFCQKPVCEKSCGVHGRCVDVNVCECLHGWRGRHCHKTINNPGGGNKDRKSNKNSRRRRRRRREHERQLKERRRKKRMHHDIMAVQTK